MKKSNPKGKNSSKVQVVLSSQYVKSMSFENYKNKSELIALTAKPETDFKLTTLKAYRQHSCAKVL